MSLATGIPNRRGIQFTTASSKSRVVAAVLMLMTAGVACAGERQSVRIGEMIIVTDASIWHSERRSEEDVILHPVGDHARRHDAVRIFRRVGGNLADCLGLAASTWREETYSEPRSHAIQIGGRDAIEVVVHTRCRNATPPGSMACVGGGGDLYTLELVNRVTSCRAYQGVLFADPALRDGLFAGITLTR